jgi:hypothetical protein
MSLLRTSDPLQQSISDHDLWLDYDTSGVLMGFVRNQSILSVSSEIWFLLTLFLASKWQRYHPIDLMTVSHPTLTRFHLLGDCGWAQGNAKAAAGVANRRVEPVPGRSPTIECKVAPTAASAHAVRAIFWSSRIADGTLGVFTVPVVAPLPDVPVHVV